MLKIKVKRFRQESVHSQTDTHAHGQTDRHTHTHGRYQTYYLPCYAVDKNRKLLIFYLGIGRDVARWWTYHISTFGLRPVV